MKSKALAALSTLFVVAIAPAANAASTLSVPTPYATLSAALSAAASGDTILVDDGTYSGTGNSELNISKSITIRSVNGAAKTFIQPGEEYFIYASAGITLQGFTIENISNNGAVSLHASSTIADCVFTSNSSGLDFNGTISVNGGTATVSACSFDHNSGEGAIYVGGANLIVTNSTFTDNTGADGSGAIYANTGTVTISGSTFTGNTCGNDDGGAITMLNGAMTVTDTSFVNNSSPNGGGAIFFGAQGINTPLTFTRTLFSGNRAPQGGAFYVASSEGSASLAVTDSVFLGNVATTDGSILFAYSGGTANHVTMMNSSFFGNDAEGTSAGTFAGSSETSLAMTNSILFGDLGASEISTVHPFSTTSVQFSDIAQSGFAGMNGNIDADPGYTNPTGGDLHIAPTSPCAGTGTSTGAPASDFAQTAWGTHVSMGAFAPSVPPLTDGGADAEAGADADAGETPDATPVEVADATVDDAGGVTVTPPATPDAASPTSADASVDAGGEEPAPDSDGCSCDTAGTHGSDAGAMAGALGVLAFRARRRRRPSKRTGT